ncbi:MAG: hypothetical protein M1331_00030, partial [Candidatus Marsarchaeota archaeon]|nr:hypothetical protein [Candidatus Marsarchaeota archaeon]
AMLRDRIKEDIETFKENEKNYKELKKEKNKIKENIFEEVRKFEALMYYRKFNAATNVMRDLRRNSGSEIEDNLIYIYAGEDFEDMYAHGVCRRIIKGIETGQIPGIYDELDALRIAKVFNFNGEEVHDIALKTYFFELKNKNYRTAYSIRNAYGLGDDEIQEVLPKAYRDSIVFMRQ